MDDSDLTSDRGGGEGQSAGAGGGRRRPRKKTIFHLADDEDSSTEHNMSRLLNSVEEAARRVVQQQHHVTGSLSIDIGAASAAPGSAGRPILGVKGDEFFQPPSPYGGEAGFVNIRRPVYSQSSFAKAFEENRLEQQARSRFFDSVLLPKKSDRSCLAGFLSLFPFVAMLRGYKLKSDLPYDIASGITTGVMRIPQSMAYALLARLPPSFGLYTAFFTAVTYFLFGSSHHLAAGAQGVISLMVGAGVERVLQFNSEMANISMAPWTNTTTDSTNDHKSDPLVQEVLNITVTITFLVGVCQALLGVFRLGFITNYLSDPLIGGFTTGAACHVVVTQLPTILGFKTNSHGGNFNLWFLLIEVFSKLHKVNVATFLIFLCSFAVLCVVKYVNERFKARLKIPIPGELIVLTLTILVCYLTEAESRWSVHVLGVVPSGFLAPRLPDPGYMQSTLSIAFPTAIVSFAIGYAIAKRLALQHDYEINGNQEIFAFGFMNATSSFFNCFAATGSMSVSSLHESLGGRTQIANLVASLLVLFTLLFVGPIFKTAPDCGLSAILLINLKSILFQFKDLRPLWSLSRIDFLLWLVTWAGVIILDVDAGLLIGVAFSLMTIVFRTQWPYTCILGRIPSTDIYKNRTITPNAKEVPGIKIFRFEGSLYFASAEHFRNSLYRESECNPVKILRRKLEVEQKLLIVKEQMRTSLHRNGSALFEAGPSPPDQSNERASQCLMRDPSATSLQEDRLLSLEKPNIHHIVIDFSACSFVDSVGVRTLSQVIADYQEVGIYVCLANVRAAVRSVLLNAQTFANEVDAKNIFLSVHDAVLTALDDEQRMDERDFMVTDALGPAVTQQVSRMQSDVD